MVRSRSRGFTLVELLVVITIIGMLMALLLPAVNAAVEAARSLTCKNNLGQLAKAAKLYENANKRYPGHNNKVGSTPVTTWVVPIFPQLERTDLFTDWSKGTTTAVYVDFLVCPSDPPEQVGGALLSYVANAGLQDQAYDTTANKQAAIANGVMHVWNDTYKVACSSDTMADGDSNTIMLSENIQADKWDVKTAADLKKFSTFVWFNQAAAPTDGKINQGKASTPSINTARPSAYHPGGVNAAFCDGHVLFLREDIDYRVYFQLMAPNDAESSTTQSAWKSTRLSDHEYK